MLEGGMPRQARIDAPWALHHVIARGIERREIFCDNEDREDFLHRLGEIIAQSKTLCFACALIPNDFHLLFKTGIVPFASVMRRIHQKSDEHVPGDSDFVKDLLLMAKEGLNRRHALVGKGIGFDQLARWVSEFTAIPVEAMVAPGK